jgi:hypothetical protein
MLINSAEIHGKIRHQYGIYDLGAQTLFIAFPPVE